MAETAIILDLDGTVWDSRPWYAETIARLSGDSAVRVRRELEAGASVVRVAKARGVSKARLRQAAREDGETVALYEGVLPTLDCLRKRGTPVGVVTNLPGWLAGPLLESTGIKEYVPIVATPRAGVPAKPRPHGIRQVLAGMGRETDSDTWFVGDTAVDASAANAAAVRFAWAAFGYESERPAGTDKVLARFSEIRDL